MVSLGHNELKKINCWYRYQILVIEMWTDALVCQYGYSLVSSLQCVKSYYHISNIRCALAGKKIVDHLDVVGASPAGVRRYFDPHDILTPESKYRNDILTRGQNIVRYIDPGVNI